MMLSTEAITYSIKNHILLKDVCFSLHKGELLAILGANGAGKSTLIRLLSGEKKPDSGSIRLAGKPIGTYTSTELALLRATMSQQQAVSLDFTAEEIVLMGRYPHYKNQPAPSDRLAVEETMAVCGVGHLAARSYLSLSGGEQQRVQLARVLSQIWDRPGALLLMDEPVSAMDMQFQHQTLAIIRALANRGFMVITVLHDINLAAQYADRILLMKNGRKLYDGTPAEVLNSRNIYTVFSMDVQVQVNTASLKTIVLPKEIKMGVESFNSMLPSEKLKAESENIS
ncbi:iron complex transport system ATP-binding protein [bacterium A37T11]|nr:iron complex transport system ATP-binding protein [bacterium A37T11]